ncbi:BglG family transcription antiterminator [Niallia sp. Krafla_26]|uniref:BglG family transcription antiterminator n=1 Tax=Niallia sp. Krafla_26 TaxID=3064703 RepID=UPI003D1741BA
MDLNNRDKFILSELIGNPSITSKELEETHQLTRRQLGYSINKINEYLLLNNLPVIERTRQGHFIINQAVFEKYNVVSDGFEMSEEQVVFTEEQRINLILSIILFSQEELSLNHFTSYFKVSKNTILSDLKHAQILLNDYGLIIRYSRKNGYLIEGKELQIRKLLISLINTMLQENAGEKRLIAIAGIQEQELKEFSKRVEKVEDKLSLKFIDEKLAVMPFILILILRRIKRGNVIDSFPIEYEVLSDTNEYQATEEILYDLEDIPETERLFITLHLLTTNVFSSVFMSEEEAIPNLVPAIDKMLRQFEKSACIYFDNREQLLDKLLQHIKPAYYRIKYQLTDKIYLQGVLSEDMKAIHHLVKQSSSPLEKVIGREIPDNELMFITMLIGGWMKKQGESIIRKVKAVVVCPQGVSVSKLMFNELSELFPEFVFLDSLSVREFINYPLDYDIVFSPTYIETDKKLFVTKVFLGREEKVRLRKQVMLAVHGYVPNDIDEQQLIRIISNFADIKDERALSKELMKYLNRDDNKAVAHQRNKDQKIPLNELLTPENIKLVNRIESWEEAVRICAQPLVHSKKVEPRYIDAMVQYSLQDSYIVIGPNVAIPHAAPEDGVNEVGMSLLRIKEGVSYGGDHRINIIVVIATKDKHEHIHALMQLMKLAGSGEDLNKLVKANSIKEVSKIINLYSID